MRKLLAVLLAAIMLVGVLAALPAGAETVGVSKFDGTTSDYTPDLLITEVLVNSKTGHAELDDKLVEGDVSSWVSPDAFDYIEIYNRGSVAVDLYDYALVRAQGYEFFDKTGTRGNIGKFVDRVDLIKSELRNNPDAPNAKWGEYDVFQNPEDATLMPGEFAVIWFYSNGTTELTDKISDYLEKEDFIKHYGMPEDTLLLAVPGKTSHGNSFELAVHCTYALVHDTFNLAMGVVSNAWADGAQLNENGQQIVCMADYILRNAVGIYTDANMDNMAAYYVPANAKPDVLNKVNEQTATEGETAKKFNDYVEAEFTQTYRSGAILSYVEAPSPGTMPAWQWAYVDPVGETKTVGGVNYTHGLQALSAAADGEKYDEAMKALVTDWDTNTVIKKDSKLDVTATETGFAWSANCLKSLIDDKASAITGEGNNSEVKIDYTKNFVSREELEQRHKMNQQKTENEEGLPTLVLILIIVGGVVLVGGVAVVVIIVIKKKNKPVAADDVAAEGEIQVVDETEVNEAPADENKE